LDSRPRSKRLRWTKRDIRTHTLGAPAPLRADGAGGYNPAGLDPRVSCAARWCGWVRKQRGRGLTRMPPPMKKTHRRGRMSVGPIPYSQYRLVGVWAGRRGGHRSASKTHEQRSRRHWGTICQASQEGAGIMWLLRGPGRPVDEPARGRGIRVLSDPHDWEDNGSPDCRWGGRRSRIR